METNEKTKNINDFITTLPNVKAAYGYGSGVLNQVGCGSKSGQIDLIIVVNDTENFHIRNMEINPNYYNKSMKKFFSKKMKLQHMGADVCYIPYIKYKENKFKIGIISRSDLINDLTNWKNLYMAGRFQKPMFEFKSDNQIDYAINLDRKNALMIALLIQKSSYSTLYDLYYTLLSLSYLGDIRKGIKINNINLFNFENPHKIDNIIAGSYKVLNQIYLDPKVNNGYFKISKSVDFEFMYDENMDQIEVNNHIVEKLKSIEIHFSQKDLCEQLVFLPGNLKNYLVNDLGKFIDDEIVTFRQINIVKEEIINFIVKTNRNATIKQAIKGFLSVGLDDSIKYLSEKALKAKSK